jgi:hypothetical protein
LATPSAAAPTSSAAIFAERAAEALTEALTRLSHRTDPLPGEIREEAARHHDEPALARCTS